MGRTTLKLSVGQLISWGLLYYTFAAALPLMQADLRWSATELSMGFSAALLAQGGAAPFVGRWADQRGTKGLMTIGVFIGAAGLAVWSQASRFWVYIAGWIFIGLSMAATLYEMAFLTVIRAEPTVRRRSIITITIVGALASALFMPLSSAVFIKWGWRNGLLLFALVLVVGVAPLYGSLPAEPPPSKCSKKTSSDVLDVHSAQHRAFWSLGLSLMFAGGVAVALTTYAIAFFVAKGLTVQVAASIAGAAGIAKLAGRLAASAARWFRAATLLTGALFLQAAALLIPVFISSDFALLLMMVIFGGSSGARTILRPLLIAELFGDKNFGAKSGLLQSMATLAKAAAPVAMGAAVGSLGFEGAWMALSALAFLSAGLLLGVECPSL